MTDTRERLTEADLEAIEALARENESEPRFWPRFRKQQRESRRMSSVDKQKTEAVRRRMVAQLGRKVEMRVPPDTSAVVEYRLGGQTIRISSERFEDHESPEEIFPMDAVRYAGDGVSFLLTTDDRIILDEA